jgi:hypothetical protein
VEQEVVDIMETQQGQPGIMRKGLKKVGEK